MKSDYKELVKRTRKLVNEWDPCSFIACGAPEDEYDALTNKLISGVINGLENQKIVNDIMALLNNYFDCTSNDKLNIQAQESLINEIDNLIKKIKN